MLCYFIKNNMQIILTLILVISLSSKINADLGTETGLEIPRYVSLKSNDANIRVGASKNYPIVIKYIQRNYPLKITEEYQEWRKVEDFKKNIGWIHKSLISGTRTGVILSNDNNIELLNIVGGKVIGKIGHGNIVFIKKCKIDWCFIEMNSFKGWINKKYIWGVKEDEIIEINFLQIFEDLYWQSLNFLDRLNK